MNAVTSETLLNKINESISVLQDAQQTVVAAKEEIIAAPRIAQEANETAGEARKLATEANAAAQANTAALAKKLDVEAAASDYVKKTGDVMTGSLVSKANVLDINNITGDRGYGGFQFEDKNGTALGGLSAWVRSNKDLELRFSCSRDVGGSSVYSSLRACVAEDGTRWVSCDDPRNGYNQDIVNNFRLIDFAPQKVQSVIDIFVGGANASDIADLHNGRGLGVDKPFATFDAAHSYIVNNYCGARAVVRMKIANDQTIGNLGWRQGGFNSIEISSLDAAKPVTLTTPVEGINISFGAWRFENIKLQSASSGERIFRVDAHYGYAAAILGANVTINGAVSVAVVSVGNNGQVLLSEAISGSITGKRFAVSTNGLIWSGGMGVNAIPGTEPGTVDTASGGVYK